VRVAREAGVKRLALFHHDPDHSDCCLDQALAEASSRFTRVTMAAERTMVRLQRRPEPCFACVGAERRPSQRASLAAANLFRLIRAL